MRTFPYPPIRPIVLERPAAGDGEAQPVVVFFEREIPTAGTIRTSDLLHVVDARTGEDLEVGLAEEVDEFSFLPYGTLPSGEVFANVQDPGRPCGQYRICFVVGDEDFDTLAELVLDVETLELEYRAAVIPPHPAGHTQIASWGPGFVDIITDDSSLLGRYRDGELLWEVDFVDLFDDDRTSPAEYIDFIELGDIVLVQGYQPILETLNAEVHTLDLDYVASRTLVGVDGNTGEVLWRVEGADANCYAVHQFPIAEDATSVPVCLASGGTWLWDLDTDTYVEQTDLVASIVQLDVADGSLGWEIEGAGEVDLAHVGRIGGPVFSARGPLTVTASFDFLVPDGERTNGQPQLIDLASGTALPIADDTTFVCQAERDDVDPEFEGSTFAGGANPITTGYPGGWYHFPCDADAVEGGSWTKGAVRVAGYADADGRTVVLPTAEGLVAFVVQ